MAQEIHMEVPEVEKMSKSFETFGDTLDSVAKALEAISMLLKATAWLSLGSTAALAAFIDRILPNLKRVAGKMKELSGDITQAVTAFQTGDTTGAGRFA